jgi:hypothetical protein
MRVAVFLGAIVLLAGGCGSHHTRRAQPKQPTVTYVTKIVSKSGCELSPFPTQAELRRWMRRCGRP